MCRHFRKFYQDAPRNPRIAEFVRALAPQTAEFGANRPEYIFLCDCRSTETADFSNFSGADAKAGCYSGMYANLAISSIALFISHFGCQYASINTLKVLYGLGVSDVPK